MTLPPGAMPENCHALEPTAPRGSGVHLGCLETAEAWDNALIGSTLANVVISQVLSAVCVCSGPFPGLAQQRVSQAGGRCPLHPYGRASRLRDGAHGGRDRQPVADVRGDGRPIGMRHRERTRAKWRYVNVDAKEFPIMTFVHEALTHDGAVVPDLIPGMPSKAPSQTRLRVYGDHGNLLVTNVSGSPSPNLDTKSERCWNKVEYMLCCSRLLAQLTPTRIG